MKKPSLISIAITLVIAGCAAHTTKHLVDAVTYTDNTPKITQALTTQKAATIDVQSGEVTASAHVTAAHAEVTAVDIERPDPRLTDADVHLTQATAVLDANAGKLANVVASEVQLIGLSIDQAKTNASLQSQAMQLAKDKAAAMDAADKANAFIKAHENDIFGAKVHRIVADISWGLLITIGVLIIGVGIIGSIYGLPKITQPALTIGGELLQWAGRAIYEVATFLWAGLPWIGHYVDEWFNEIGLFRRQAAVTQTVVAKPAIS